MSNQRQLPDSHRTPSWRERGQALVLIALAFVGLASFIGLAVDSGILFIQIGHLRRAVDAAALAAASQFREGRTVAELTDAATQFINLNSVATGTAEVFVCEESLGPGPWPNPGPYSSAHDPSLCPPVGDPYRKFVRVEGEVLVNFAFLPIIGIYSFPIHAEAISEAASVDLVLVIDTSSSMAFELCSDGRDNDEDGVADDCPGVNAIVGTPPGEQDVNNCNLNRGLTDDVAGDDPGAPPDGDRVDDCHPFEEVRAAATALRTRMNFPFDRMAVVTFSDVGVLQLSLADGDSPAPVQTVIDAVEVSTNPFITHRPPCDPSGGDPRGCPNTNPTDGLMIGGNLYGDPNADGFQAPGEVRQEAVWIMILLSDGAANALYDVSVFPITDRSAWICPNPGMNPGQPNWIEPLCTDIDPSNGAGRHAFGNPWYDPDDAARDMADFVGCPDANSLQPAACPAPGQGAVIFTIGLGPQVRDTNCDPFYGGPTCGNLGEMLLRYVAGVGDDGNPVSPGDPCNGAPSGADCGNYYFSPTGAGLMRVFEAIASRIFTRLTH
jgi:hypothetical protein